MNEWCLNATDEKGALFTFLHKTVHLQVNLQTPAGELIITLITPNGFSSLLSHNSIKYSLVFQERTG